MAVWRGGENFLSQSQGAIKVIAAYARITSASGLLDSQICAQLPDFRKQHHVQHLAQVADAAGAAGAALEADDAFDRGDVAKAPEAEGVFQVGKFFAELVQIEIDRKSVV